MNKLLRYLGPGHRFEDEQTGKSWETNGDFVEVEYTDAKRLQTHPSAQWEERQPAEEPETKPTRGPRVKVQKMTEERADDGR